MIGKTIFRTCLLAACLACLPPPEKAPAADAAEEYSRSGGGPVRVRLTQPPAARLPNLPKTLPELRSMAGADFLCVERSNYLVASDIGPGDYEYLVDGVLDYCSESLIKMFFDKGPVTAKKVNIFVFRNYDSYESGLKRFLGMSPISPYGHYGHSQKYIVINYETGPGTMVHELTHALMSEDFPEAPIWLAEGMASLYEHCRAEGDVLRGDDNWRLPELKTALETGTLTPLSVLLSMSPPVFRGAKESLNYAQSRYFCKYLEELGVLPTVYKEFRNRYSEDPTGAKFIAKACGKPLQNIEESWKRWIGFQYWKE